MSVFPLSIFYLFSILFLSHSMCSDQLIQVWTNMTIRTQYINETLLKHVIYFSSEGPQNENACLILDQIKLSITYHGQNPKRIQPLQKINSEYSSKNPQILIIYTNNPLNLSDTWTQQSLSLFPTFQTLLQALESYQPQVKLQIIYNSSKSGFQERKMVRDTITLFNLTDPLFSANYLKQSSLQEWYFIAPAYLVVIFLVINYFIRSFYTDKNKHSDHGEIILHYLALASPTFMVETLTTELMSFCYGFMLLCFPWMNQTLGNIFGNELDFTPLHMKVFFTDLNLGSTYGLAITIMTLITGFGYLLISLKQNNDEVKKEDTSIFFNFLYNTFIYGALFSLMLSIQGIFYNSSNGILSFNHPTSSAFYIVGIILFVLIIIDAIHSLFKYQSKHFYKIRSIVKTMFLSLSHLRVNYFIVVMIFLDLLFAVAEYLINKKDNPKSFNKLWIFKNILLNVSLLLLIFMPIKLIAVIISFVFVSISIIVQIYEHYKIYEANNKAKTNQSYKLTDHKTINLTNQTDRYSRRMNGIIDYLDDPFSQLQILPNTMTAINPNRPPINSKQVSERRNIQINSNPLKQTIQYESRHRRERRKNSLKNAGLVSVPNHKAIINSSNDHILHVRSHIEKQDQTQY